jgi:hypothetical protein
VRKNYQRKERKSNHKFEVVGGEELMVRVPLPMADAQCLRDEPLRGGQRSVAEKLPAT